MESSIDRQAAGPGGGSGYLLAAILIHGRVRIVRWALGLGLLALVPVLMIRPAFTATASFAPQSGSESRTSGLASLAGQFGISVGPTSATTASPGFFASLLKNPEILSRLAARSFAVDGAPSRPLPELLGITESEPAKRIEATVEKLSDDLLAYQIDKETGVINLSVRGRSPGLAVAIADSLLGAINDFNLTLRQGSAGEERRFTEARLAEAQKTLRGAEDRLESFLKTNRQYEQSPELRFEADRRQRDVLLNQQIVTTLSQALEDVRIREIRDTPLIMVLQRPRVPTEPGSRPWLYVALALVFGTVLGAALELFRVLRSRLRDSRDVDAQDFVAALDEALAPARRFRTALRSPRAGP